MNFMKQIQSDFYRSKGKNETFLEWFLIRKLDTKGKILFALFLWSIWIYLWTDIVLIVRIFQFVVLVEGILLLKSILSKIYRKMKNKKWLSNSSKSTRSLVASSTGNFETKARNLAMRQLCWLLASYATSLKSHFLFCVYYFL